MRLFAQPLGLGSRVFGLRICYYSAMSNLLPEDSPRKNLPSTIDPKQRVVLDGIRYSIEIAELSFNRLFDALLELSKRPDDPHGTFVEPFLYAWSFIDATSRMRSLLPFVPEYESSPEILCFISETEGIRSLRDNIQHLNDRIDKFAGIKLPPWGAITWFFVVQDSPLVVRNHIIGAGTLFASEHKMVLPIGKLVHPPLDLIRLDADGAEVYLREILDQVKLVSQHLSILFRQQAAEGPQTGSDFHWNMTMEYGE
jgi:hypothetical protein